MSSFGTHMLIGVAGGIALVHVLPPSIIGLQPVVAEIIVIGASALLATWPDIDEPRSFIGRRVQLLVTLLGIILGGMVGMASASRFQMLPLTGATIGVIIGTIVGSLSGTLLLKGIRVAAGGHRRATHSLLLGAILAVMATCLWMGPTGALKPWALIPAALAWGQFWHILGDIVTPAGVPILYPLSTRDLRVLPKPLSHFGEAVAAFTAALSIFLLIRLA